MAVRKGWSAHNDIGLNLEMLARNMIWPGIPYGADNTIFSASEIESNTFVEAMVCLLRKKFGYGNNAEIDRFIEKAAAFFGKSVNKMDPDVAQGLYDEFEELFNKKV